MKLELNFDNLLIYAKEGLLKYSKHPKYDLHIFDYSKTTQYDKRWDYITLNCRGVIMDSKGKLYSRPFPKFFNFEEKMEEVMMLVNESDYTIQEKMDGSLGQFYLSPDGEVCIATRGAFFSDQAVKATEIYNNTFTKTDKELIVLMLKSNYTPLFEIIYPENRIVVNYGDVSKLVFLDALDIESGDSIYDTFEYDLLTKLNSSHFSKTEYFPKPNNFKDLKKAIPADKEGFVIVFDNNYRVKIKGEEYVRLHPLLTQMTTKTIWECLRDDVDMNQFIENVPDEFYNFIIKTKDELTEKFQEYMNVSQKYYDDVIKSLKLNSDEKSNKKELALAIKDHPMKNEIFSFYEGQQHSKSFAKHVWNKLKPETVRAFVISDESS